MTTPEDQRTVIARIEQVLHFFELLDRDGLGSAGRHAVRLNVKFESLAADLKSLLASLPQGPPASTSELGRIEPIPAIALLRTFSFPAYPQLFQSTDGGCTEVLIEDADVQKVRDFLKFSSEPDQQPADDSEGRAAAEEKPSALPQARAVGDEVQCERCAGNGEIVTDWARYRQPRDSDRGDEAVAECPDCCGRGTLANPQPALTKAVGDEAPIPMVLHCPACGLQHIDAPEADADIKIFTAGIDGQPMPWTNPPHRSHFCHGCGYIWRPADVPTDGVAAIPTRGKVDSPLPPAPGWRGKP